MHSFGTNLPGREVNSLTDAKSFLKARQAFYTVTLGEATGLPLPLSPSLMTQTTAADEMTNLQNF